MYKWQVKDSAADIENILDKILVSRGIVSEKEKELFLYPPKINYWVSQLPSDFKNALGSAKKLILSAINSNTPIIVHGDYDVDGVCATAILYSSIKYEKKYDHVYAFIPNRFEHGYGLSFKSVEACLKLLETNENNKKALIITVDSGITSVEEVQYLKENGHSVVITDHHQKPDTIPSANAVLWDDNIVGTSISWLLSLALGSKNPDHLCYACLATVTDLQPLLNFNRSIVKYGLEAFNKQTPGAFKELITVAGRGDSEITVYDLGWVLGPRLNASGRIDDAMFSLKLLLETDPDEQRYLARRLDAINSSRQDKTEEMYGIAGGYDEENVPKIIISHNENYHEGIIGLVASKIVQKHNRPAIVISTAELVAKGSVRSISGINIIELLRNFSDLFESLGGHPMAAGFSIKHENIPILEEKIKAYAEFEISDDDLVKVLEIDLEIPIDCIDLTLLEKLEKLSPHGVGNPKPLFSSKKVGIGSVSVFGRESNHLSVKLQSQNKWYKAVFFNHGYLLNEFKPGDYVDIAYTLKKNTYNEKTYVDLMLEDIKKS